MSYRSECKRCAIDRMASGLLLMTFGVLLVVWYYRMERAKREMVFRKLAEGNL